LSDKAGSNKATLKALGFIENLDEKSMIADLGSGTGAQTMVLAENTTGTITAIDLFPKFIDILNSNANRNSMQNRVNGIVGSMDNLPFQHEELDLIWSEGAIYNIGFKKGIDYWRQFLKKGGYLAVSEACWLTQDRPGEIF
jgi:Methylase of polypeptide chain release factors